MALRFSSERRRDIAAWLLAAALLSAHSGLLVWRIASDSVTIDEIGHIPAGLLQWRTGSTRLYRVNPPLFKWIASWSLHRRGEAVFADWSGIQTQPGDRSEFQVGREFAEHNAAHYPELVRSARLAGIGWSIAGGLGIFLWTKRLFGRRGGLLALTLWSVDPIVLAFAPLAVADVPAATAGLWFAIALWAYLERPVGKRAAVLGLALGLAVSVKFTMLVLFAVVPLAAAMNGLWFRDPEIRSSLKRRLGHGIFAACLALAVFNATYGFRDVFHRLDSFSFVSRAFSGKPPANSWFGRAEETTGPGNRWAGTWLGRLPVPLPADALHGIDEQRLDFERFFPSYRGGEWRDHGWWDYYLYALAVKWPLGSWGLWIGSLAVWLRCWPTLPRALQRAGLVLGLTFTLLFGFVSSQTGFSHHMRYVLPAIPLAIASMGALGRFLGRSSPLAGLLVLGLGSWTVASSLAVMPHSIAYFNEAAGGPEHGHEYLINSNIDWGQDLVALKDWLDQHPEARPLRLACMQLIDPRIYGIPEFAVPSGASPSGEWPIANEPGYHAISVNLLRGMGFAIANGQGGFEHAPSGRFARYLELEPIARLGYSIYVYRVDPP